MDQKFCQDCADISFILSLTFWAEMLKILTLGTVDAVFLAIMSAFLLPFIDEWWLGIHINLIRFPLAWWAKMMICHWIFLCYSVSNTPILIYLLYYLLNYLGWRSSYYVFLHEYFTCLFYPINLYLNKIETL